MCLAQKEKYASPSTGTDQIIIYIDTPSPVAKGSLDSNILSLRERGGHLYGCQNMIGSD